MQKENILLTKHRKSFKNSLKSVTDIPDLLSVQKESFNLLVQADIDPDKRVDLIDIFRPSKEVPHIVDDTIKYLKPLGCKTVWMQIGIRNKQAALRAKKNDLNVIMDKCPKIENQRLFGELRVAGFNTNIISSKIEL